MFAYCNNNPVVNSDPAGNITIAAIVGGSVAGAVSGAVSYLIGCLLSGQKVNIEDLFVAIVAGAVNGAIGVFAGAATISGKVIAAITTGVIAAYNTAGKWYEKLICGGMTALGTFGGSFIDTSAVNELAEFVVNFAVTSYISIPIDIMSVCIQEGIEDPPQVTITAIPSNKTPSGIGSCARYVGGCLKSMTCIAYKA